jgi:hypothetical protein
MVRGMGKRNRRNRRNGFDGPPRSPEEHVETWFDVCALRRVELGPVERAAIVEELFRFDRSLVLGVAERQLLAIVDALWRNGWQPAELVRHVRRTTTANGARLARQLIAADHARHAADAIDARWLAQLERLDVPHIEVSGGWLLPWAVGEGLVWPVALDTVLQVLGSISSVAPLAVLIPPPGTAMGDPVDLTGAADDPVLERVRALLAQAESTTFDAEAETFTAKAQELITRHAIDEALLAGQAVRDDAPIAVRIPIDDPYAQVKAVLVTIVAEYSRCQAVWDERHALATLVGMAHDVAGVELLFTSLLVQAQSALQAAARTAPPGARTRSRGYRSTFLFAYANRVGERLEAINAHTIAAAEAELGTSLLPVLAARESAVDAKVRSLFSELRHGKVRGAMDSAGWAGGRAAADVAKLNAGDLPDARTFAPRALEA